MCYMLYYKYNRGVATFVVFSPIVALCFIARKLRNDIFQELPEHEVKRLPGTQGSAENKPISGVKRKDG